MTETLAVASQALAANPLSLSYGRVMIVRTAKVPVDGSLEGRFPRIGEIARRPDVKTSTVKILIMRFVLTWNTL
jgi:hypothetical protein